MLKCDSTSAINKLWKTLNYFRQLISAYKMAAHNYFLVCVPLCLCLCVSACLWCWFTVAHFLNGPPSQSTCSTAVAVKQFVSLMHFAAAKSCDCQLRPGGARRPRRPTRPNQTKATRLCLHGTKWRNGSAFQWNLWRMETLDDRWRLQVRVAFFLFFGAGRVGVSWLMLMLWHQQIYGHPPDKSSVCVCVCCLFWRSLANFFCFSAEHLERISIKYNLCGPKNLSAQSR